METKSILITGATKGIGRHAALHFVRAGHHVIATGRDQGALDGLHREANGLAGTLDTLVLDVTDAASIARAVEEVALLTEGRAIDVLINNAGYGHAGAVEDVTDAELRAQFDTNVFGAMAVTRAFLPQMRARRSGRILNISSIGGRITFPLFGVYHASKYALEALSDAMRSELAPFGIDVVLIEPGPIRSEFSNRTFDTVPQSASPYTPAYENAAAIKATADAQAYDPIVVSRAMERAVMSRRPRARYVAPGRLSALLSLLTLLPTRWVDWMMRRYTGLTAKRMLPA